MLIFLQIFKYTYINIIGMKDIITRALYTCIYISIKIHDSMFFLVAEIVWFIFCTYYLVLYLFVEQNKTKLILKLHIFFL